MNTFKLLFQYILPKLWITRLAGWCASKQAGWLTKLAIDLFIKYYKVDMKEVKNPDTRDYCTFNEFFVRAFRDDARPINIDPNVLVIPADGIISQIGHIKEDRILQAKGQNYSLEALLAGDSLMISQFRNGSFITIYLSPRDYHRVHIPCNSILREMIYVPGDLFSINYSTTQNLPNLFARNERVICLFDTEFGAIAQILIGAIIVGSIETVWMGRITPPREGIIKRWTWPVGDSKSSIMLLKGQEMGRFNLGSTVISLFSPGKIELIQSLKSFSVVKIGEPMAISSENVLTPDKQSISLPDSSSLVNNKNDV